MEDLETFDNQEDEAEESEEFIEEHEDAGLSFDDIVSFAMLTETTVTLVGIIIFFLFTILKII